MRVYVLLLQACVDPQTVQLVPSKALVLAGDKLPVLATVTDATPAPMENVPVTFTTTFQPLAAGSQRGYSKESYGSYRYDSAPGPAPAGPPVTTTSTALTNTLGQALLLVSTTTGQAGQFTVQASVPTCTTGQVLTSNAAQISVVTGLPEAEHQDNHHGWNYWHGSHRQSKGYEPQVGDKNARGRHSYRGEHSTEHEEERHHHDLDAQGEPSYHGDSYSHERRPETNEHQAAGDAGDSYQPPAQEHHTEGRHSYESPAYEERFAREEDDFDKPPKEEHYEAQGYSHEHEQSAVKDTEGGGSYVLSAPEEEQAMDESVMSPHGSDQLPSSPQENLGL